jgi:hypothetical protein
MNKTPRKRTARKSNVDPSPYPPGWNHKRVQAVIDHYDKQSDDKAIAEANAAYAAVKTTMIQVPVELVPQVEKLIAKRAGSGGRT